MRSVTVLVLMLLSSVVANPCLAERSFLSEDRIELVDERLSLHDKQISDNMIRLTSLESKIDRIIKSLDSLQTRSFAEPYRPPTPDIPKLVTTTRRPAPAVPESEARYRLVKAGCRNGVCYYRRVPVSTETETATSSVRTSQRVGCSRLLFRRVRWRPGRLFSRIF